ncbi:uncharacterized protein EDB91DRAFT_1053822 [Suillus paluster]|uniref:uncharacterized protein n=1 Tax=Suillus paluster TaxID=48578 RepID=UPI001B869CE0|nr:uncharacterized protein EDB91DRAFT_1053822 [Suillus paluster]KAG1739451.1 hypothetical protein EDB91DRAFT_1053822 [Suillus paluster]
MAYSDRSISSSSSTSSPPSQLVALPSMTHSLAALPTMSAVPQDMLHYSNSGSHSRAKATLTVRLVHYSSSQLLIPVHQTHDTRRTPSPSCEDGHITVRRQNTTRR